MTCMNLGVAHTDVWVIAEPFIDHFTTENPFGMSIILAATFSARILFQHWKTSDVHPRHLFPVERIAHVRGSVLLNSGIIVAENDEHYKKMMAEFSEATMTSFLVNTSPTGFIRRSKLEWGDYHRALVPGIKKSAHAPYPFDDILEIVRSEAPWLITDERDAVEEVIDDDDGKPSAAAGPTTVATVNAPPTPTQVGSAAVLLAAQDILGDSSGVDADTPLMDAGLDSLGATALRSSLQDLVGDGMEVPATLVFEAPTARQIAAQLVFSAPAPAAYEAMTVERVSTIAMPVEEVVSQAAEVIGGDIDADTPLMDAGLDSLGATALRSSLQDLVGDGMEVPATLVFEAPTARQIAAQLVRTVKTMEMAPQPQPHLHVSAQAPQPAAPPPATSGMVKLHRQRMILDDFFPTYWYAFSMTQEQALGFWNAAASLRTRFTRSAYTKEWRWKVAPIDSLPIKDKSREPLDFTDRKLPMFYESSVGTLWLNHSIWDAVSLNTVVFDVGSNKSTCLHFSVHEDRVQRLCDTWEAGEEVVDALLRGPRPFDEMSSFELAKNAASLPASVFRMVKRYCARVGTSPEMAWYAVIFVLTLQCRGKSVGVFWIQASNRDTVNQNVVGYVTTEVGVLIEVDLDTPLEDRLSKCLRDVGELTTEHLNVFPEIAMPHPMYGTFMECSLGVNLLGASGPDDTDRSVIEESLSKSGKSEEASNLLLERMNWIEVGSEEVRAVCVKPHGAALVMADIHVLQSCSELRVREVAGLSSGCRDVRHACQKRVIEPGYSGRHPRI